MTITDERLEAAPANNAFVLERTDRSNAPRHQIGERLHHLFEQRCDEHQINAATSDDATEPLAVVSPTGEWSFGELDRLANRIAHWLLAEAVRPGDHVGVVLGRSADTYATLLAISKIGAVFVPMDASFPVDRVDFICEDSGADVLVTNEAGAVNLEGAAARLLIVDQLDQCSLPSHRPTEFEVGPMVTERSYVIYTSGSTGKPKGVPINQDSICNFVRVAAEEYGYIEEDRVYQGLTIAFDFSVEEIWVPLLAGAALVPNETGASLVGDDLTRFLEQHQVTALCCVPTLLATVDPGLDKLRLLILSGEACPSELAARWHRSGRRILNAYGPTETTVTATVAVLEPDETLTIGQPLPTYSIVILDPDHPEVLAKGAVGEIGIAGIGVSPGYLNRPEKTAAAFVPDFLHLPNNPTGLIYRSGDLGRINDDDNVEYLGRIDTQVKIRGYRIELIEIESVLLQLDGIAQAAVEVFERRPGHKELVAYYSLTEQARRDAERNPNSGRDADIAAHLRQALPAYMVPSQYEELEALPLLPSDKVDRKALPAPSLQRLGSTNEVVPPETELEEHVAATLADLLGLEEVSVVDNFFDDFGADSLTMAQLGTIIRTDLDIADFEMRDLYAYPTVRALAERLETAKAEGLVAVVRTDDTHIASTFSYIACGVAQIVGGAIYGASALAFAVWLAHWTVDGSGFAEVYQRAFLAFGAFFVALSVVPILLKWALIGRWKEETFPIWGWKFFRYWFINRAVAVSPAGRMVGTPLQIAHLKALGADISWNAVIQTKSPLCTDLISIGDEAVVMSGALLNGHEAISGRIHTGPVSIGDRAFVGMGSALGIGTAVGNDAQLAHASALLPGQAIPDGERWHGAPAEPTSTDHRVVHGGSSSVRRRVTYSAMILSWICFVTGPLLLIVLDLAVALGPADIAAALGSGRIAQALVIAGLATGFFFSTIVFAFVSKMIVPRLANRFIVPGIEYPLYGWRYALNRSVRTRSNSKFFNDLLGDSSAIPHYLSMVGLRVDRTVQTGSNFGTTQKWDNPFLTQFGAGTMVSDNLNCGNTNYSPGKFAVHPVVIKDDNFFGNNLQIPVRHTVGNNVLLATKAMFPIDGDRRENVGLLGSPAFEIPRSVERDREQERYQDPDVLAEQLRRKLRHNIGSMAIFVGAQLTFFISAILILVGLYGIVGLSSTQTAFFGSYLLFPLALVYFTALEWVMLGFRRLQPRSCSIYDEYFWSHERFWKVLGLRPWIALAGTPLRGLGWRLLGMRVGKKLYDAGAPAPEASLVTIGDHCTINGGVVIQGHSLEDGAFKSDHIVIGDRCSLSSDSFIHYGTELGAGTEIAPSSFVMKGQVSAPNSRWEGNPAAPAMVRHDRICD